MLPTIHPTCITHLYLHPSILPCLPLSIHTRTITSIHPSLFMPIHPSISFQPLPSIYLPILLQDIYTSSSIYSYIHPSIYNLIHLSLSFSLPIHPYPLSSIHVRMHHLSISISINLLLDGVRERNHSLSCSTLMNSLFQLFSHQVPTTQSSGVNGPNCRSSFPKRPGGIHDVLIIWCLRTYSNML